MTLQLDVRRRAMLEEIGVRVFDAHPDFLPADDRTPPSPPRQAAGIADLRPAVINTAAAVAAPALRAAPTAEGESVTDGMGWEELQAAVASQLPAGCARIVFGAGDLNADWVVVGDVPGEEEEAQGLPFAGDAGRLLDNMLAAVGASRRKGAYLTHVLKWRPAGSRNPEPEEMARCEPFLRRQLELLRPRVVLVTGRFAVQALLQTTEPIGKLRGRVHRYRNLPVVVTYHPAYLLRNLPEKARAWADLCMAQAVVRTPPG